MAKAPAKTRYQAGEYFSTSGMVALATYDDGSEKAVYGYDVDPATPLSLNDDEVTITFNGKNFTVSILVEGGEERDGDPITYPMGRWNEDYVEEVVPSSNRSYVSPSDVEVPWNDTHTDAQYAYLCSDYNAISQFAGGTKELSRPLPYIIELDGEDEWYIEIAEDKEFTKSKLFHVEDDHLDFYNGKLNLNYYWRAANQKEDLGKARVERFLLHPSGPRNLYVDGVANVRDIGGYPSKLGGVIRQGLYYRGGRLNASNTSTYKQEITEDGLKVLLDDLGVKVDLDLRMNDFDEPTPPTSGWSKTEFGANHADAIEGLEFVSRPLNWNHNDMMLLDKPMIGEIFRVFAREDYEPVYLHCNIGTDRTGMITFLLGTLCGMHLEDLYRDYLFSNFSTIQGSRDLSAITSKYQKDLEAYGEYNLYYDTRAYLAECGLSEEELDRIVTRFVDFNAE